MPPPLFRDSDLAVQERLAPIGFQTPPLRPEERGMQDIKAACYAMIELLDDVIGSVRAALDRTGQSYDTLVFHKRPRRDARRPRPAAEGLPLLRRTGKVPLLFSWPRGLARGMVSDALVELVDVAPTLLDIAGLEPPEAMRGRSLLPLLRGETARAEHRPWYAPNTTAR